MNQKGLTAWGMLLALAAALAAPAAAAEFSDEAVEQAIKKGAAYLVSQRRKDGYWAGMAKYPAGPTALAAYALLTAGVPPQEPGMTQTLEWLKAAQTQKTYVLGLRANVWLLANRTTKDRYLDNLRRDVATLILSTDDGSYGYDSTGKPPASDKIKSDNSNSQYGLLGVWAGAQGDLPVPPEYWVKVLRHWQGCQLSDGGWTYRPKLPARATMTAAGVASLFVCVDNLYQKAFAACGETNVNLAPVHRGLKWIEKNFADSLKGDVNGYYLYGLERVALASGYKYFGPHDWYKLGGAQLLNSQGSNGAWDGKWGPVVETSFALLFLCRGRHAILFNKLEFRGDWNNRPRDMVYLTRWVSDTFERPVNWQIINARVPVREWQDAPILYLSGEKGINLNDGEIAKLRRYVWQGGTIFSATECSGAGFRKDIRDLYKKLFPQYELTKLLADHPLYDVHYRLRGRPTMWMVSNGVRPLAFHTDVDLPQSWQLGKYGESPRSFDIAANLYLYVTDKGILKPRGTNLWPLPPASPPASTIRLARLKHAGESNPEPLAYERFTRMFAASTPRGLQALGPMPIADLPKAAAPLAALTGVGELTLTAEERTILKDYVAAGGTLVIDAAGGDGAFDASARKLLAEMYGPEALKKLPDAHPLYANPLPGTKGLAIQRVNYRRATLARLRDAHGLNLEAVLAGDRPGVIYSREDITAGLVGYPCYGVDGYDPGDARDDGSAFRILRNIVLYAGGR